MVGLRGAWRNSARASATRRWALCLGLSLLLAGFAAGGFAEDPDPATEWMKDLPEEKHEALRKLFEEGKRRMEARRAGTLQPTDPGSGKSAAKKPRQAVVATDKGDGGVAGQAPADSQPLFSEAWFREHYPAIERLAQDEPTDENVRAWLIARRILDEKKRLFEEAARRVIEQDPQLAPLSETGEGRGQAPGAAGPGAQAGASTSVDGVAGDGSRPGEATPPVPEALRPWVDWAVRDRRERLLCTWRNDGSQTECGWPGRLKLAVTEEGAEFLLEWRSDLEGWVPLPGDAGAWPVSVRADASQPVAVVERAGRPWIRLGPRGERHVRLSGELAWIERPASIALPPEVVLYDITVDGAAVPSRQVDASARLWLPGTPAVAASPKERITVSRLLSDGQPVTVTTRLELQVEGDPRVLTLRGALPDGFLPLGIASPLAARIDGAGVLEILVRPGRWWVEVSARALGDVAAILVPGEGTAWPEEELWVVREDAGLRSLRVEGGRAVGERDLALPAGWVGHTRRLRRGESLALRTQERGLGEGGADRLALQRTGWLDFSGAGMTFRDLIQGSAGAPGRLEAHAGLQPERVLVNGTPRGLTRVAGSESAGVALDRGAVTVEAESRFTGPQGKRLGHWPLRIPAAGWDRGIDDAQWHLQLPPGWRLVLATGSDQVRGAWAQGWSLLDLFAVSITVLVIGRLYGLGLGALAGAALALSWTGSGALGWLWLGFAGLGALHVAARRRASAGSGVAARSALAGATALAGLALLGAALWIAGDAARSAVFPQLAAAAEAARTGDGAALPAPEAVTPGVVGAATGTGLEGVTPSWSGTSAWLAWHGSVPERGAALYLLAPWQNRLVLGLEALLTLLLALLLLRAVARGRARTGRSDPGLRRSGRAAAAAAAVVFAASAGAHAGGSVGGETPPGLPPAPEVLEELAQTLTAPPACAPTCVGIARAWLVAGGEEELSRLTLVLSVEAEARLAVPVLEGLGAWRPEQVSIDGEPVGSLGEGERVWAEVPAGSSRVELTGRLPHDGRVELRFPVVPRQVQATMHDGWELHGVDSAGATGGSVTLVRQPGATAQGSWRGGSTIVPLVRVQRTLRLGEAWELETLAVRLSPGEGALTVRVPLIEAELVDSTGPTTDNGYALVAFGPGEGERRWSSRLAPRETIALTAAADATLVETWRLAVSDRWHAAVLGAPEVGGAEPGYRQWRPWPGESVEIDVAATRPAETAAVRIASARLEAAPRRDGATHRLTLVADASAAVVHRIGLPAGAVLEEVLVDGVRQAPSVDAGRIGVPLGAGRQTVSVSWRAGASGGLVYATPAVDLGGNAVNAEIQVRVDGGRWVLWTSGPRVGPALIGWLYLAAALALVLALSRLPGAALGLAGWLAVAIGLAVAPLAFCAVLAAVAVLWSTRHWGLERSAGYRVTQVALIGAAAVGALGLYHGIAGALLGLPGLGGAAEGSAGEPLQWYQDRTAWALLPTAVVFSVPAWVHQVATLLWSLLAAGLAVRLGGWWWESWQRCRPPHPLRASGGAPAGSVAGSGALPGPRWPERPRLRDERARA